MQCCGPLLLAAAGTHADMQTCTGRCLAAVALERCTTRCTSMQCTITAGDASFATLMVMVTAVARSKPAWLADGVDEMRNWPQMMQHRRYYS